MTISYDDKDDILFIRFNDAPIIEDVSYGWNVNIGVTAQGIGQITILDAKEADLMPIHVAPELRNSVEFVRSVRATNG